MTTFLIVLIFLVNVIFIGTWLYSFSKEYKKRFASKFAKKQKTENQGDLSKDKGYAALSPTSPKSEMGQSLKGIEIEFQSFTTEQNKQDDK